MTDQAEWGRPAGWYDVGGGWAAYWDGQAWTGDRMPSAQRWPGPPQHPVGQPRPGVARMWGTPWFVWAALLLVVLLFAWPLAAAFVEGFTSGFTGR